MWCMRLVEVTSRMRQSATPWSNHSGRRRRRASRQRVHATPLRSGALLRPAKRDASRTSESTSASIGADSTWSTALYEITGEAANRRGRAADHT